MKNVYILISILLCSLSFPNDIFGNGSDGDLIVNEGDTYLIDSNSANIVGANLAGQNNLLLDNTSIFEVNDEIVIAVVQDDNTSDLESNLVGTYETYTVSDIYDSYLVLTESLNQTYTDYDQRNYQVRKVFNFEKVIVNGTMITSEWDDTYDNNGLIFFKVRDSLIVNGSISVDWAGYAGGGNYFNNDGDSNAGQNATGNWGGAGGGGAESMFDDNFYLGRLLYGGGGGAGCCSDCGCCYPGDGHGCSQPGQGGIGAGAIAIFAKTMINFGNLSADGKWGQDSWGHSACCDTPGGGGGGGGGTVLITTNNYTGEGNISVNGGAGSQYSAEDGGNGYFYIETVDIDCNGDVYGSAYYDGCNVCASGDTGVDPNSDDLGCGCFLSGPQTYYFDVDGDGLGNADIFTDFCENSEPDGWVDNPDDIDDTCYSNNIDCNNNCDGGAYLDDCDLCSEGFSGHVANSDIDCSGTCFGDAIIDDCGECNGNGYDMCDDDGDLVSNLEQWGHGAHSVVTADIPEDQGGRIYMSFYRSFYDTDNLSRSEAYTIERKDGDYWVVVQSFGAYGSDGYNVEVNTLQNNILSEFRIIANMDEGNFETFEFIEGISLDNIDPATPENVNASAIDNNIDISWDYAQDIDFSYYQFNQLSEESPIYTIDSEINTVIGNNYDECHVHSVDIHNNKSNASDYVGAHDLHAGANLVGICVVPEDNSIGNVIGGNISGVIGAGVAGSQLDGTWVGSLTQINPESGYWVKANENFVHLTVGNKYEIEEYILSEELGFISYCCIEKSISSIDNQNITSFIGEGQAAQRLPNGTWVGSLTELSTGSGYWVKSNGNTTLNFDCTDE